MKLYQREHISSLEDDYALLFTHGLASQSQAFIMRMTKRTILDIMMIAIRELAAALQLDDAWMMMTIKMIF